MSGVSFPDNDCVKTTFISALVKGNYTILKMFFQIIACVTLATLSCGAPQKHHAISYISSNLEGHGSVGSDNSGLGTHYVQIPTHTITKHVPIIIKQEVKHEKEEYSPDIAYAAPQQHHATSYVSTKVAGLVDLGGDDKEQGGHYVDYSASSSNLGQDDLGGSNADFGGHYVHYAAPTLIKHIPVVVKHQQVEDHKEEEHEPAKYEFHYAVEDKHSGDIKSQKESRNGDVVKGEYTLKEADGTTRIVKYSADKKSGFNAVVIRKGHAAHPQVEHKKIEVKKILVPVVQHHDEHQGLSSYY